MTLYIRRSQKECTCIGIHYLYISGNAGHRFNFAVTVCTQSRTYILTGMPFRKFILYITFRSSTDEIFETLTWNDKIR